MRRRKAGAGSMATTSCPSSFKVSGSLTGSKLPPTRRLLNPEPLPPETSGHHQNSVIARADGNGTSARQEVRGCTLLKFAAMAATWLSQWGGCETGWTHIE